MKINSLEKFKSQFKKSVQPKVDGLAKDYDNIKQKVNSPKDDMKNITSPSGSVKEEYNPEVTVVGMRIPFTRGEDIFMKACDLINNHLNITDIKIVCAMRTPERN